MNKKEQWADAILNSFEGIKSASPKDDLFDKIISNIPRKNEIKIISIKQIGWVSIAVSIVIILNISALRLQKNSNINMVENQKQVSLFIDYTF